MSEEEIKCLNNCGFANVTQLLLAYVGLQQENSQLKERIKKLNNQITKSLHVHLKKDERIEKAIEYIETHKRKDEFLELNEWGTRELLEILKGDNK